MLRINVTLPQLLIPNAHLIQLLGVRNPHVVHVRPAHFRPDIFTPLVNQPGKLMVEGLYGRLHGIDGPGVRDGSIRIEEVLNQILLKHSNVITVESVRDGARLQNVDDCNW